MTAVQSHAKSTYYYGMDYGNVHCLPRKVDNRGGYPVFSPPPPPNKSPIREPAYEL